MVDSLGEGIPVAWAISNSEDGLHLTEFLSSIRERVNPRIFMSDDADQYFNSWKKVFGAGDTKKLLCAWHVDKSWRKAFCDHVESRQEQVEIYHILRALLIETAENGFRVKLQQLVSYLRLNHERFALYFEREYVSRIHQWATFHRIKANMFVESFHRLLKVVYLEQKQNRRIDTLIHQLLRIVKHITFDQLIKLEKGKRTFRLCEINKRHKAAEKIKNNIQFIKETWTLTSQQNTTVQYEIQKLTNNCSCNLSCTTCGACIHMYSCTCMDSTLHATVCKYSHVLHMEVCSASKVSQPAPQAKPIQHSCTAAVKQFQRKDLNTTKADVLENMQLLQSKVHSCTGNDILKAANTNIKAALSIITASEKHKPCVTVETKKRPPPNTNHDKQPVFHSTKKKRRTSTQPLAKPTCEELKEARKILDNTYVRVCGECHKEDDKEDVDVVQWIECSSCSLWIHTKCAQSTSNACNDTFLCKCCL